MKIAIDISPLTSGHAVRGVGFYLKNLLAALKKYHPENEYIEFVKNIPENAEIIHYPYFDPFFITLPLFHRIPIVVTVHDLTPLILKDLFPAGLKGAIKWQIQKRLLAKVGRIITDSTASKKDIEQLIGINKSKIDSIYLAAGEQFFLIKDKKVLNSIIKKYTLPNKFALYVGDGTSNKNVVRLARACLEKNIPLVIVGKVFKNDSLNLNHLWLKDVKEVRKIAKENAEKLILLGFVPDEDLVMLYNAASVFVMPSLYEGFGLPILEAFSCGVPVVCSNKGSLREVAGNAACIIDPYNVKSIAEGVEKVFYDKQLSEELSKKGIKRAGEFSWEKTADQTNASYKKLLLL